MSRSKNLILAVADPTIQNMFSSQIGAAMGDSNHPLRLETLVWWEYFPAFNEIYDEIIRIPPELLRYPVLLSALRKMEKTGKAYDVILLTHGYPNHLVADPSGYFLSWKELAELDGKLAHLNMVFMQACYSFSLARDWVSAGARAVLGFDGLNQNFFYIGAFLERYREVEVAEAYRETSNHMEKFVSEHPLYRRLIESMGISVGQYLGVAQPPRLLLDPVPVTSD